MGVKELNHDYFISQSKGWRTSAFNRVILRTVTISDSIISHPQVKFEKINQTKLTSLRKNVFSREKKGWRMRLR